MRTVTAIVFIVAGLQPAHAADFFCLSGDVNCLIDSINNANGMTGKHIINLEPGLYSVQIDNAPIGLPPISGSIRIQGTADDPPTVIEGVSTAFGPQQQIRIFRISAGGELDLNGVILQMDGYGGAISNLGVTSLKDSIVIKFHTDGGAINNSGTLNVINSIISDNFGDREGGAIFNSGKLLIENSTLAHNFGIGPGGFTNFFGEAVVRNSSIIFNSTDCCQRGGGIGNFGGSVEIVNSTIAKNQAGFSGGGIYNSGGFISITNSTIRENRSDNNVNVGLGGGIANENDSGIVQILNSVIAGNVDNQLGGFARGPDCLGTITSLGNNLVGDLSDCNINFQPSDLTGDPGLGSLVGAGVEDEPGTARYPILAGSALIDRGNPNACLQNDQLNHLRVGVCDIGAVEFGGPVMISIDIRPKKDSNRINTNSNKDINVAIFSVNGFDATTVNLATALFGRTGNEARPERSFLRDVNGDGLIDVVLRFNIDTTGIRHGDTQAALTAEITGGQRVIGFDSITTVGCKKTRNRTC